MGNAKKAPGVKRRGRPPKSEASTPATHCCDHSAYDHMAIEGAGLDDEGVVVCVSPGCPCKLPLSKAVHKPPVPSSSRTSAGALANSTREHNKVEISEFDLDRLWTSMTVEQKADKMFGRKERP